MPPALSEYLAPALRVRLLDAHANCSWIRRGRGPPFDCGWQLQCWRLVSQFGYTLAHLLTCVAVLHRPALLVFVGLPISAPQMDSLKFVVCQLRV